MHTINRFEIGNASQEVRQIRCIMYVLTLYTLWHTYKPRIHIHTYTFILSKVQRPVNWFSGQKRTSKLPFHVKAHTVHVGMYVYTYVCLHKNIRLYTHVARCPKIVYFVSRWVRQNLAVDMDVCICIHIHRHIHTARLPDLVHLVCRWVRQNLAVDIVEFHKSWIPQRLRLKERKACVRLLAADVPERWKVLVSWTCGIYGWEKRMWMRSLIEMCIYLLLLWMFT